MFLNQQPTGAPAQQPVAQQYGAPPPQHYAQPPQQYAVPNQQPQGGFQQAMQPQQAGAPQQPYNAMVPTAPAQASHGQMMSASAAAAAMAASKNRSSESYGFHLKLGETKQITFLDGNLTAEGMFDVGHANEHNIKMGPKDFDSYQCLNDYGRDCPMCTYSRDVKNGPVGYQSLKGYFTVIDHTGYTNNEGTNTPHQRKLYKASKKTIAQLGAMVQALGQKDGHYSLAGRCFQVSRSGDKAAGVGDIIIPMDRYDVDGMLQSLRQQYPDRADTFCKIDYSKVLDYIDENQIYGIFQKLGSASHVPFGHTTGVGAVPQNYGAPAPQQNFGQPPQQSFGQPPQQNFGAPPQQTFGAPPQQNFGAPPPQNLGAPQPQTYGAPQPQAPQYAYAAPGQQPGQPPAGYPPAAGSPPWNAGQPQQPAHGHFITPGQPAVQQGPVYGADVQPPNFNAHL